MCSHLISRFHTFVYRVGQKQTLAGWSKMLRCKAPEIARNEAYSIVRRSDEE
jgi:hypothetical protein